jgi:iron complex outermembrane receptor protein
VACPVISTFGHMPSFRLLSYSIFSVAVASLPSLRAAPSSSSTDHPVHLESFTVTASPYARQQAELAQPTSILAGRELLLNQSNSLGELLSGQPGVSSTYFGPGASRPVIRGLGGDRIRMLTDGAGTLDASVISPDHAVSLDPLLIERVEVLRGPSTLLYGGNAIGGVVNVIDHRIHTTRPAEPFNARLEARFASGSDEESGGAVLEGGTGPWAWHVDAYRRNAGNVSIPGFAKTAALRAEEAAEAAEHGEPVPSAAEGYLPNTAHSAEGGAIGFSLIGTPGYIGFAVSEHASLYGVPEGAHAHSEAEGEAEETSSAVRIDLKQRRFDVRGALITPVGLIRESRFRFGSARYRHTELEGDEVGTVFRTEGFDGRLELLHQPVGAANGLAGWQGGANTFEAVGEEAFLPPSRTHTNALFVLEEIVRNPVTWQLGARIERQSIELRDLSGIEREDDVFSASSGVVWTLNDTWTLGASLAHAERAPNVQELFADGPHVGTNAYELGDPSLRREKSLALDLTLRKRLGFVTGAFTVFANRFDGYIFEQATGLVAVEHDGAIEFLPRDDEEAAHGGLEVFQFVQQDADFHGAELETIFHLHHTAQEQLDLVISADVVRAENTHTDAHLPRIPPSRLKTGIAWARGAWSLGGEVQWVARQKRLAENETPTDGYALASVYASYRMVIDRAVIDLFVRGSNLNDAEARMHTSFLKDVAPLPGRSVTIGLRTSF